MTPFEFLQHLYIAGNSNFGAILSREPRHPTFGRLYRRVTHGQADTTRQHSYGAMQSVARVKRYSGYAESTVDIADV